MPDNGLSLHVNDLVIERGGRRIIEQLSFKLTGGSALLLTGPNGAGKTTLLRGLAGLLPLASGLIDVSGQPVTDSTEPTRFSELCHFVGHTNGVKPQLTVRENLAFWAMYLGAEEPRAAVDLALLTMRLEALSDIPSRYLSAGQQRRVALARLLVADRAVWLLDEPTASLDTANAGNLVELGNAHLDRGGMIVAATHLPLGFSTEIELDLRRYVADEATA